MVFCRMFFLVGALLFLVHPMEGKPRKKRHSAKKKHVQLVKPSKKFYHEDGNFSIMFPGSHGEIIGDTSLIATAFGSTQFYAFTANAQHSASMIAYYELDMKKVADKDAALASNSKLLLDTLQAQLIANLGGEVQRKVKIVREGLYHSRSAYFRVKGKENKMVFFRCENVIAPPKVYQLLYQSSQSNGPDGAEAKKFFQSFSLKPKK